MNPPPRIASLAALCEKPARLILGLMSGTSLDGLDLALCRIEGHGPATRVELLHSHTEPYAAEERERLRALAFREEVSLRELTIAHGWLAERHATAVLAALAEWGVAPDAVDCLASHGQTIYHAPESWAASGESEDAPGQSATPHSATMQIGDGDRLALRTGILTVSDFRQKEIAGGGQGAPLAPYAEALLFGGGERPRILLNLGGIANFTWLAAEGDAREPISGDTGPANTLLDLAVRRWFPGRQEDYDRNGAIAAEGRVNEALLGALKAHPYFALPFPKSTGPEVFGEAYLDKALAGLPEGAEEGGAEDIPPQDVLATLTSLTAHSVAEALLRETPEAPNLAGAEIYPSGGGRSNATLMQWLAEALPGAEWRDAEELGLPPDFKEAMLFAVLANESLCGAGFPVMDGSGSRIAFGKISFAG